MQKIGIKYLVIFNGVVLLAICSFLIYNGFVKDEKIVYVDNVKLFDGFKMTKEMKAIGEKEFNLRKTVVDSLYTISQSQNLAEKDKEKVVQEFILRRNELDQFGQQFASEEANKIWKRIHSYTQEFAKEKGYKIILGNDNKSNVLFADESVDVTNYLINYLNVKYEGLN